MVNIVTRTYVLFFRPSDSNPLTSDKANLVIKINVPVAVRTTDVRLPDNNNVESFTVDIKRPNGNIVPVDNAEVIIHEFSCH